MAKSSGNNPMMMGAPGEMTAVNINGNHKTIEKILFLLRTSLKKIYPNITLRIGIIK